MSETVKITPSGDMKTAADAGAGSNRTVVTGTFRSGHSDNRTSAGGGNATSVHGHNGHGHNGHGHKQDVEDLVTGVDINPYISLNLDASSSLESALDTVESKYAMLTEFAEGGTATVSIARDKNLHRLVAVKTLKRDAANAQEQLNAFITEAKVTAQLDHPGIIPIYGLSRDGDNGIDLVMKLVDGRTLREYLRNLELNYRIRGLNSFDENIELRKRLELFLHVCDTIAYAHHRSVIHRDLKPENIMIGRYMEVYVMDWGLAKVLSEDDEPPHTNGQLSGTPRYFPPEVLHGKPLDLRSDIFTLGLILQETVTLQYAVSGNDPQEFIDHILKGNIEPIEHKFGWKIDKTLKAIIRKATEYDIDARYQTAEDLAEDLRRYMGGLPVSARPDNLWDKIIRFFFHRDR